MIGSLLCDDIVSTIKKFRKLSNESVGFATSKDQSTPLHGCDGFCDIVRGAMVGICTKGRQVRLLSDFPVHECSSEKCILVPQGDHSVCLVSGKVYDDICQLTPAFGDGRKVPLYDEAYYASHDYALMRPRAKDGQAKKRWMDPDHEHIRIVRPKTELELLEHLCKNDKGKQKKVRLRENNETLLVSPTSYLTQLEEKRAFDKWVRDLEDEMMNTSKPKIVAPESKTATNKIKERAVRAKLRLSTSKSVKPARKRRQVALAPDVDTGTRTTGIFARVYKKFFDCARSVIIEVFVVRPLESEIDNLARSFVYLYSIVMDGLTIGEGVCHPFSMCVLAFLLLCDKRFRSFLPMLPVHREGIDKSSMALITETKQIDINNCLRFLIGRLSQCESRIESWDQCKVKPGARFTVLRDMIQKLTI